MLAVKTADGGRFCQPNAQGIKYLKNFSDSRTGCKTVKLITYSCIGHLAFIHFTRTSIVAWRHNVSYRNDSLKEQLDISSFNARLYVCIIPFDVIRVKR